MTFRAQPEGLLLPSIAGIKQAQFNPIQFCLSLEVLINGQTRDGNEVSFLAWAHKHSSTPERENL